MGYVWQKQKMILFLAIVFTTALVTSLVIPAKQFDVSQVK